MEWIIAIGIAFCLLMAFAIPGILLDRNRRMDLAELATAKKLSFVLRDDGATLRSMEGFQLFSRETKRKLRIKPKVRNIISGNVSDLDMKVCDYSYEEESRMDKLGISFTDHRVRSFYTQSVMSFQSARLSVPSFVLLPENLFHKIGNVFGFPDIDFADNPKFSSKYLLRGEKEAELRAAFSAELQALYEQSPKLCTEAKGDRIIFYRAKKRLKPDEIEPFMNECVKIFNLLCAKRD